MSETILGIIPARSGSKGVKNKNIREVAGKPLIEYTIEDAIESNSLTDFLVSTDSKEFAAISRNAGAPVPFLRPAELATHKASSLGVVQHAITEYESQNQVTVDLAVLLQPTTPLRTPQDIDEAISLFQESEAESLVTCYPTKDAHPNHLYERDRSNCLHALRNQDAIPDRRQEFEPIYILNGAVYISTRDLIFKTEKIHTNTPVGYQMPRERSVNIDEPFDMELAEFLIEKQSGAGSN